MPAQIKDWTIKVAKARWSHSIFNSGDDGHSEESVSFSGTETEAEVQMWKLQDKANDWNKYEFIVVELYEKGHEDDLNPVKSLWIRDDDDMEEKPFEDIYTLKDLLFRLYEEKAR